MKKVFVLVAVLSLMLFGAGMSFAATSAIDNVPGGAGVATFQVGNGWQTLINVQHRNDPKAVGDVCAMLHVAIYDQNSTHVIDFNMPMTNRDNVGIVLTSPAAGQLNICDYSDGAFGGSAALNDCTTGPMVAATVPALADGSATGYVTVVRTDAAVAGVFCTAPGAAPFGNISGATALVPDSLIIRTAYISGQSAFAFNSPMLQGFLNLAHPINENNTGASIFVDTFNVAAPAALVCDANANGTTTQTAAAASLDDGNGANIDFAELLITNIGTTTGIVCDDLNANAVGDTMYNAMGAVNALWWARFNVDPAAGTSTNLSLTSPNYANRGGFNRSNNLSALSYNDAETPISFGPIPVSEVELRAFGTSAGAINPGTARAGESLLTYNTPSYGYSVTTNGAFTDLYPLVRDRAAINYCDPAGVVAPIGFSCVLVGP